MSLIGSRKSGISARLVVASARAVVVMAHQDTGGLLRRPCAWLAPALGSAMATPKAVHAASPNAPLTIFDVETTPPGPCHVRIAVAACGRCRTDHALRRTKAVAGDGVAVLGIGGLGHLGVQWARAMGFETIAIARGANKEANARDLGAHHYIDSTACDVAAALQALGGASLVLATAANSAAMAETVGGLSAEGELITVGVTADPLPIAPI